MEILPLCFKLWTISGSWRPIDYCSPVSKFLYSAYSLLVLLILYSMTLFEFVATIINFGSVDDFANYAFMLLSMMSNCYKATNTLRNRARIIEIQDMLTAEICGGRNAEEQVILEKFAKTCRSNTRNLLILMMSCAMCLALETSLYHVNERILPIKVWLPYSLSSLTSFYLSYLHQIVAMILAICVTIANDTYISGLMVQTCAQLDILKHRLVNLHESKGFQVDENYSFSREKNILKMCIQHHNHIFKFKAMVEKTFSPVVSFQIFISTLVVCVTALTLIKHELFSIQFVSMILYFFSIVFQLLVFCWYGNEVILKSTKIRDVVFEMNWIPLPRTIKKDLILVMMRADKAIKFTSGYVVTLSLDSYMAILKLSYTTFNVLQQSS